MNKGFGQYITGALAEQESQDANSLVKRIFELPLNERRKFLHVYHDWPRFLYKFKSAANEDRLRSIIVDNKLYLSHPRDFNDPFDMRADVVVRGTIHDLIAKYKRLPINPEVLKKAVADARAGVAIEGIEAYVRRKFKPHQEFERMLGDQGVHCFAAPVKGQRLSGPRSNLMWSHYAESHKGICLQYEVSREPVLVKASRVEYGLGYPVVNFLSDALPEEITKCVLSKDLCWAYEGEWRYIKVKAARHQILIDRLSLKSILIGSEASAGTINLVKGLSEERKDKHAADTMLFQATRSSREYRLYFRRLT